MNIQKNWIDNIIRKKKLYKGKVIFQVIEIKITKLNLGFYLMITTTKGLNICSRTRDSMLLQNQTHTYNFMKKFEKLRSLKLIVMTVLKSIAAEAGELLEHISASTWPI